MAIEGREMDVVGPTNGRPELQGKMHERRVIYYLRINNSVRRDFHTCRLSSLLILPKLWILGMAQATGRAVVRQLDFMVNDQLPRLVPF
jgi:hypothetical protein